LGLQFDDGSVERNIAAAPEIGGGEQRTALQARQLAAAVLEAADELERLA
jgi:hypothetical protein